MSKARSTTATLEAPPPPAAADPPAEMQVIINKPSDVVYRGRLLRDSVVQVLPRELALELIADGRAHSIVRNRYVATSTTFFGSHTVERGGDPRADGRHGTGHGQGRVPPRRLDPARPRPGRPRSTAPRPGRRETLAARPPAARPRAGGPRRAGPRPPDPQGRGRRGDARGRGGTRHVPQAGRAHRPVHRGRPGNAGALLAQRLHPVLRKSGRAAPAEGRAALRPDRRSRSG